MNGIFIFKQVFNGKEATRWRQRINLLFGAHQRNSPGTDLADHSAGLRSLLQGGAADFLCLSSANPCHQSFHFHLDAAMHTHFRLEGFGPLIRVDASDISEPLPHYE
jgi:hypothetical protein